METNHPQLSDDQVEALVLRRLRGELDAAGEARLAAALEGPRQAAQAAALERSWQALELPQLAHRSVAPAVLARLRRESASAVPAWAQWAAAAVLMLGIGTGWGLGMGFEPPAGGAAQVAEGSDGEGDLPVAEAAADLFGDEGGFSEPGLGESLWLAAGAEAEDGGELQ